MKPPIASIIPIALLLMTPSTTAASVLALEGATLVDGTGADPVDDATVVIRGDTIDCAGPADACPTPDDAEVHDVSDHWIIPGLVDTHVHLAQTGFFDGRPDALDLRDEFPFEQVQASKDERVQHYFDAWLCSGVTAVFDMGGFPWSLALAKQTRQAATTDTSELAATGPLISHNPQWLLNLPATQQMLAMGARDTIRSTLDFVAAFEADAAKLWFLPVGSEEGAADVDERVGVFAEEAQHRDLPLAAHATTIREARVALDAGADILVHSVDDAPLDDEFLAQAREADVVYIPTLLVGQGYVDAYRAVAGIAPFELDDPNDCVDPHTAELLEEAHRFQDHRATSHFTEARLDAIERQRHRRRAQAAQNLKRAFDAGITIAAGTDAGNPGTPHGPSIHAELEAMQKAGIPPADVLVMATRNGARAMGRDDVFGTVKEGNQADLVVLSADPTEDIAHLREIEVVVKGAEVAKH